MARTLALVLLTVAVGAAAAAPARDGDPLLIGTKWKGKLTQRGDLGDGGAGPDGFDCVLTVTGRDGDSFEGELFEQARGQRLTYIVKGEVAAAANGKDYTVTFTALDAKNVDGTGSVLGTKYTATLSGRALKGTWKHIELKAEGEFSFEMTK